MRKEIEGEREREKEGEGEAGGVRGRGERRERDRDSDGGEINYFGLVYPKGPFLWPVLFMHLSRAYSVKYTLTPV